MKKLFILCGIIFTFLLSAQSQTKEQVIDKVWAGVGGKTAFEKARYLQFTFASERNGKIGNGRNHVWDRYTGDYRFENTANGKTSTVLFNVNNQTGKAYEDGVLLPDTTAAKLIKRAYAAFINDTYWLMVPLKLQDPGVNTELAAAETIDGTKYDIIHLNFDKVGLTPGDQYWLYVNDATGEIGQWKFLLQNQKNSSTFVWDPYQDLGNGLKLSLKKTNKESNSSIVFPDTKVLKSVDQNIFIKP
ncbi:MAG: hypothetical protein ABIP95_14435 [Pelobium sp.]